jgi:hypothetical protein
MSASTYIVEEEEENLKYNGPKLLTRPSIVRAAICTNSGTEIVRRPKRCPRPV